tara:strand:- start:415 stop:816 length:402 start_codon:yes stop_codon:yes gene_type:complete
MKQQVVFKKFTQTKVNTKGKDIPPCSTCKDTTCVLLPRFKNWPCYQGSPKDAALCYNTDPLLRKATYWRCGECSSYGYKKHIGNDPVYTNMELWVGGVHGRYPVAKYYKSHSLAPSGGSRGTSSNWRAISRRT